MWLLANWFWDVLALFFTKTSLPTRNSFPSTLYTHWWGRFGGSVSCPAPCSVVISGIWGTVVCLCNQTCATASFLSLLGFFFKVCESESLLTSPMFHNNPIITALFLSLPLLLFLVWAGVPQAYSTLPWVLTLLVEGMVWINVQQHRSSASTLSSASRASSTAALAEACTCLFAWSAFAAITLGSGASGLGYRWRWWLLSTGLWQWRSCTVGLGCSVPWWLRAVVFPQQRSQW